MPSPLVRRLISVPALLVAWVLLVVLAVPALIVFLLLDLGGRRWRLGYTRVYLLVLVVVTNELLLLVVALTSNAVTLGGRLIGKSRVDAMRYGMQDWWFGSQLFYARVFAGVRLRVENPEEFERGNFVVAARHFSHYDALFPAYVLSNRYGLRAWYTAKQELQWPPAMDLIGNQLHHVWIDRAPEPGSPMFDRIRALGSRLDETQAAIIFPEGTFFTAERKQRAVERLARTNPDRAARAKNLNHLLPPRPSGFLALLEGAPDADVMIMGNAGIEDFSSLRRMITAIPTREPATIRVWRYCRSELPTDAEDLNDWLLDRWLELDKWVGAELTRRGQMAPSRG